MKNNKNKVIAVFLVLTFIFQFAGCSGKSSKLSGEPGAVIDELKNSILTLNADGILSLTMEDKGSTTYKEYKESLNIETYADEIAGCYLAVAKNIELNYGESDIEIGNGIAKVHVTLKIPAWKKVFGDTSLASADDVISAIKEAETEKVTLTLRLIDTKDGLKIKNTEDLMDLFGFIGWDIASAPSWSDGQPNESTPAETKPSESEPSATDPVTPEPTEPSEEPSESEPPKTPSKTEPSATVTGKADASEIAAAKAAYLKAIQDEKEGIDWYEKSTNLGSFILYDINNDDLPELFFFTKSALYEKPHFRCKVFSYNRVEKKMITILNQELSELGNEIAECFVALTKDGEVVAYKGFYASGNSTAYYSYFRFLPGHKYLTIQGSLFNMQVFGSDKTSGSYTVNGFDKYKEDTKVDKDEFNRLEKKLMDSTTILVSGVFTGSKNSPASEIMGKKKIDGMKYADIIKELS